MKWNIIPDNQKFILNNSLGIKYKKAGKNKLNEKREKSDEKYN